jgi:hypothetical protein
MPVIEFVCPSCGTKLKAASEKAGRKGKCARCAGLFTIPEAAPGQATTADWAGPEHVAPRPSAKETEPARRKPVRPAPPEEEETDDDVGEEEEDRPRRPADPRAGWRKVRLGLLLLLVTTGVSLVLGLFGCISGFLPLRFTGSVLSFYATFAAAHLVFDAVSGLTVLAGYALCRFVPPQFGSRKLATAALVLGGVGLATDTTVGVITWRISQKTQEKSQELMQRTQQLLEEIRTRPKGPAPKYDPEQMMREAQEATQLLEPTMKVLRMSQFHTHLRLLLHSAQYLLFAYFLMGLARSLENPAAALNCLNLIKLTAVLLMIQVVHQVAAGILLGLMSFGLMRVLGIFGMVVSVLTLAQTAWFFMVLLEVRGLVGQRAGRVRRKRPGARQPGK